MPAVAVILFSGNLVLTIVDAAIAYRKAENIVGFILPGSEAREAGAKRIRSFLPLMVALYTLLDCNAYSLHDTRFLLGLTILLAADIILQRHLAGRGQRVRP